ncbi:MAG TPA: LacI family DNA-binding transcriptional regulator [Streptosporangiales bacterium]
MKRPTIVDIARAAGVSKGAVSYALNGRPGVSADTRARILQVASELGWVPSSAARALSNHRADAVGMVAFREPEVLWTEPYFMRVIAGVERTLAEQGVALLLATVHDTETELDTYRRWWAGRRVDGALLLDMRAKDPRPALLRSLGMPAVVLGAQRAYRGIPCARVEDQHAMVKAVTHLAELGHERIARVSGPLRLEHAALRWTYFEEASRTTFGRPQPQLATDYTAAGGLACTERLLGSRRPPTAIIYDNDVMAAAAVTELTSTGVRIPADLAVLAWDDSPLCELVRPAITAFTHDVTAEAGCAARLLLDHVETGAAKDIWLDARALTVRASTVSNDG